MYIRNALQVGGKNLRNQRKDGGISVELTALVSRTSVASSIRTASTPKPTNSAGIRSARPELKPEERALLLVVHAYREDHHAEEIIRIISARAAEKHEIRRYREEEMD